MSIAAADIRRIREVICDRLALVSNIGTVMPTRKRFASREEWFATVGALTTQKLLDTTTVAACFVHMIRPHEPVDGANEKIRLITYLVRLFRETFETRLDETETPDAYDKKVFISEDTFDAAAVNIGYQFREELNVGGLNAALTATILPIETEEDVQFGAPEYFPTVEGAYVDFTLRVELLYDDC